MAEGASWMPGHPEPGQPDRIYTGSAVSRIDLYSQSRAIHLLQDGELYPGCGPCNVFDGKKKPGVTAVINLAVLVRQGAQHKIILIAP